MCIIYTYNYIYYKIKSWNHLQSHKFSKIKVPNSMMYLIFYPIEYWNRLLVFLQIKLHILFIQHIRYDRRGTKIKLVICEIQGQMYN